MQNFCYNFIKNKQDDQTKILLTNIDNLIYKIEVESVDNDSYKDKQLFEMKGEMKGETCGCVPIKIFIR